MHYTLKPTVLILCGFLAACTANPLDHKSPHDAARLLTDASLDAMKQLDPKVLNKSDHYRQCMEHPALSSFNCEALYKAMCEVLGRQGMHVTLSNLKDKAMYSKIADNLEQLSYYSI